MSDLKPLPRLRSQGSDSVFNGADVKAMRLKECRSGKRIKLSLTLLLGAVLLLSSCGLLTGGHISRGEEYLGKRRYHEAVMEFKAAVESDPSSAEAHFGLARAYEGLKNFYETIAELQKAYNLDRFNPEIKAKLGNYYLLTSPPLIDEAMRLSDEILNDNPQFVEGYVLRASTLTAKGAPQNEILETLNTAIQIDPKRVETYMSLARYFMRIGDAGSAESSINRGIAADPSKALGYTEYGRFLVFQSRDNEAVVQFSAGIEAEPSSIEPREALAEHYASTNQIDKAESVYLELVHLQENAPESRMALADFYMTAGRGDDAIASMQQIVGEIPTYSPARQRLAEILLERGEVDGATEQVNELINLNDKDPAALALRARLALADRRPEDALNDLTEVLKVQQNNREALYLISQVKLSVGDVDQAYAYISDLEKFHPTYLKTGLLKIQALLAQGEGEAAYEKADELVRVVENTSPGTELTAYDILDLKLRSKVARGLAALRSNKMDAAASDLESAKAAFPKSPLALTSLAKLYVASNMLDEARQLFDQVVSNNPGNFDALTGVVNVLIRQGNASGAHARLDRMISTNSTSPKMLAGVHYLKATTHLSERKYAEAEGELAKVIELDENYFPAYAAYAALFVRRGETGRAVDQLANVVNRKPTSPIYTLMAMLEESRGRNSEAADNYRKALELKPGNAIAANNLAWMMVDRGVGNLDEALKLAETAVDKSPSTPEFYDTLGWIHFKKGNTAEAVENLRKAVVLEETDSATRKTETNGEFRARLNQILAAGGGKRESTKRDSVAENKAGAKRSTRF